MNALELRALAYVLAACGFTYLGSYPAGLHYEAIIQRDKANVAQLAAQAAVAAKAQQDLADTNNRAVVGRLQSQLNSANDTANDFAVRLRDAEARGRGVSQAPDKPGTAAAPGAVGADRLTELLAAAAAECERNEARQDALINELRPQL